MQTIRIAKSTVFVITEVVAVLVPVKLLLALPLALLLRNG